jgi:hypothetical protein
MPRAAAVLALCLAFGAAPAIAQVLFKLIDKSGKVTYSDSVPKNFQGTVVRIEPDTESNVVPSGRGTGGDAKPGPVPGKADPSSRGAKREALEKALAAARARVEAARKAKADGGDPRDDEVQVLQRQYAAPKAGDPKPKPNCFLKKDPHGRTVMMCPGRAPNDAYYERQAALDRELRDAEEALAEAERAYRRGTD